MKIIVIFSAIVVCIYILFQPSLAFAEQASCDEWANFTKIVSYKFRDRGRTHAETKEALNREMGHAAEIDTAQGYVDYAYNNADLDPVEIWMDVYKNCQQKQAAKHE